MKNKKLIISVVWGLAFLCSALPVSAQGIMFRREEIKNEIKEGIKDGTAGALREKGTPVPNLKDRVKALLPIRVLIGTAKLTAISGTTLIVDREEKSYTVNTGTFDKCATQLRRRFWGKSELSEFSVGDVLNVMGYWTDDTKTAVNACYIRNISIQKRYGVFIGEVKSVSEGGFVMTTISDKRSDQTVTIISSTKYTNRRGSIIAKSDLAIGHKVRVRGLWDRNANTVTEVTEVKDFSLPPLPTGRISATPTPTEG